LKVVPFVKPFGGPLDVGGQIEIKGKVKPNAQRFSINLQQGTKTDGSQVIALHLNPRFKGAQGIVVMNTKSGKWAEEERIDSTKNPFRPDGKFTLTVRRQADCFEILVNGVELKKFKHRVNANMADAVAIEGDVILESVLLS
jgi:Galactoside-binding lectin